MTAPTIVELQLRSNITLALTRLRQARESGDCDLEWVAERWMNRLLDQVPRGKHADCGDCAADHRLRVSGSAG